MHRKLNKPSLLSDDEDDNIDEEISNYNKNSNKFLKSNRDKDNFQKELEKRVTFNRSVTPKSIDSDINIDSNEDDVHFESLNDSNHDKFSKTSRNSNWEPNVKKSPRTSFLKTNKSDTGDSLAELSEKSKTSKFSKQNSIFNEDSNDLMNGKYSENRFAKSPRDEKSDSENEFSKRLSNNRSPLNEHQKKNSKIDNAKEKDDDDSFLKTLRYKDSENFSRGIKSSKKKSGLEEKPKTSFSVLSDDEDSSLKFSNSRFMKTQKAKIPNEEEKLSKFPNESQFNKMKSSDSQKKFDFDKNEVKSKPIESKKSNDNFDFLIKSHPPELEGSSKLVFNDSIGKFDPDKELQTSTRFMNMNVNNNEIKPMEYDIKPKPRKSQRNISEFENSNDIKNSSLKDDFKRRSIRFEDDIPESYEKKNKDSRESSPRKSDVSRHSSRKNTPSPPTSVCEEVIQDPVTLKLEAIKKRREEKKREDESKFESLQNQQIINNINIVADCQNESEPNKLPTTQKKSATRPSSAKYKNVQPKTVTRINLKSMKPQMMNDDWSSTPNLCSAPDDINSERSYISSQTIREAAYLQWYLAKLTNSNSKKNTDSNNGDEKKKSNEEERVAAYEAWKKAKHDYFLDLDRKRKESKKKEDSVIPENKDKKSAELAFEVWKKQKEEKLKEETKIKSKQSKEKELALMKEREEKKNKKTELISDWESAKAKELKEKKLQKQKEDRLKAEKENEIKDKLVEAEKAYRAWEEKNEIKIKQYCEVEKSKAVLINNRRAWRPSSTAINKTRRI